MNSEFCAVLDNDNRFWKVPISHEVPTDGGGIVGSDGQGGMMH